VRTDFRDGVNTIKSAYEEQGIAVRVDVCSDHFARLWVTDTHSGQSGKVELAADIRSKAPVTMSIGPVVHVDDVAGGKMEALSPAPRHGTSLTLTPSSPAADSPGPSSRNSPPAETPASILEFSPTCSQSSTSTRTPSSRPAYGLHGDQIQQMRERFAEWRAELLHELGPTST